MKFISSLITAASGSVAGSTYSRNANGAYIRNKAIPTNANTLSQQAARARFSAVSVGWKDLTNAERASFQERISEYPYIDSLGQTKTYTASQLYKYLNGTLVQSGLTPISTCQPPVSLLQVMSILCIADQSAINIGFDEFYFSDSSTLVPDNCSLVIYATSVLPASITNVKRSQFKVISISGATEDLTALNLTTQYEAVFGNGWRTTAPLVNNVWFGVRLVNQVTGQSYSAIYQASAVINA
jgi:hypothetical protein